jgi:hypothetical protein
MSAFMEFRCPLCGKPLASDEYYHAIGEMERKQEEKYAEEIKLKKEEYERKIKDILENKEKEISTAKKSYEGQLKLMQETLESSYRNQLDELKKQYDQLSEEKSKQSNEILENLEKEYKKRLETREREIEELKKGRVRLKQEAEEEANKKVEDDLRKLKDEIRSRDIQLERAKNEIENIKRQFSQSQPELKGEIGERDLCTILSRAFPEDSIRRQKRGTSSGDIIQQIRLASGKFSDTPIVYDNKESEAVTKHDVEKAQSYKEIHGTNYVIIVSENLPKEIKNSYFGEKDGVLVVHRSIVVEIAKMIREAIIEIEKQSKSGRDRETKESKLYDYVKSQDFSRRIERLLSIYQKMQKLQENEERAHARLWKERKYIQSEINSAYTEITTGIESIIQETPPMVELFGSKEMTKTKKCKQEN